MNKLFITAAILAVSVSVAEAKCTKKSLNGNWSLGLAGGGPAFLGSASGGTFTFTSGMSTLTLSVANFSSTSCKGSGSGTVGATPITFKINSEKIPGSAQKPNHLLVQATNGVDTLVYSLQRQ